MAAAVALLSVAATVSDHEPVPSWSVSAALILAGFGVIAVTQAPGWTRAVEGSLVAGAAWAIAATFAGKLVLVLYGAPIAAIVGGLRPGACGDPPEGDPSWRPRAHSLRALGTVALSFGRFPTGWWRATRPSPSNTQTEE